MLLPVSLSVCLSITRFKSTVESVFGCLKVTSFIVSNAEESLFLSCLITSRLFISSSLKDRVLWLIRLRCLSVSREYGFETSIHILVDRWFHSNGCKVLHRLHVWLAACWPSSYRLKKLFYSLQRRWILRVEILSRSRKRKTFHR